MGATRPKQYLPLLGRPVIAHTLARLCAYPRLAGVWVGIANEDNWWSEFNLQYPRLLGTYSGGPERASTVLNGLQVLARMAQPDDWVLVHDAVRPCVTYRDLDALLATTERHADGALLGARVADTIKRVDAAGNVVATVPRHDLWRALTPQVFRLEALAQALEQALAAGRDTTDEASAIEAAGGRPRMVEGSGDNIKITRPEDLALAEMILRRQGEDDV